MSDEGAKRDIAVDVDELGYDKERLDVRFLVTFASILLGATVMMTFGQVILRFVFNNPQAWAEEVLRYLFVWIIFTGSTIAVARRTHIRVTEIEDRLGPRGRSLCRWLRIVIDTICFLAVLISGFLLSRRNISKEFFTLAGVPLVLVYAAVPINAALSLFYLFRPRPRITEPPLHQTFQ
jgi:TRAP-type C4-dicarboxylate transport system permease small subunit